ncbi:MAG: NAD(P)H-dependent oxidoreductase [Methanobacteriaceae archaeon]|nr:NAD(P)H-dependent oxidoreductase [Methanobacteriaceae archaeon]
MKTMTIYYSSTGRTELVANTIVDELDSDIVKIKDLKDRKGLKNKMISSLDAFRENKTKIQPIRVDLTDYNTIFFGTPTWASNPTPAIITIIDRCDLRGKDVILFTTMSANGGSPVIKRMKEKVEARGARVIGKFILKTKNKSKESLKNETKYNIKKIDLNK